MPPLAVRSALRSDTYESYLVARVNGSKLPRDFNFAHAEQGKRKCRCRMYPEEGAPTIRITGVITVRYCRKFFMQSPSEFLCAFAKFGVSLMEL